MPSLDTLLADPLVVTVLVFSAGGVAVVAVILALINRLEGR